MLTKKKIDDLNYFISGSGKTAAFLIPILSRIFEEGPPPLPDVSKRCGSMYLLFCGCVYIYIFFFCPIFIWEVVLPFSYFSVNEI